MTADEPFPEFGLIIEGTCPVCHESLERYEGYEFGWCSTCQDGWAATNRLGVPTVSLTEQWPMGLRTPPRCD